MGRVEPDAPQHPAPETIDDAPPLDDDLYEPPSDYKPPPQAFPPPQDHHPAGATSFPPPEDYAKPQAYPPPQDHQPATPFPPPQDHHAAAAFPQPFPPPSPQKPQAAQHFQTQQPFPNPYIQQQPNVAAMQQPGVALGYAPSPFNAQVQQIQLQTQPWKTSLFDCMKNPQNALITLFFPCVTFGQIAEILDSGTTTCGTSGLIYSMIACCIAMPCLMSCSYRTKLRSKYGLMEGPAPDWVIHCFCEYCALCQEYRELEERGFDPTIGWMGNVTKQQQKQQYGMTPPMHQTMM